MIPVAASRQIQGPEPQSKGCYIEKRGPGGTITNGWSLELVIVLHRHKTAA